MRRLINYIRSCFCKHEWELIFDTNIYGYDFWGRLESMPRYHEKHTVVRNVVWRKNINQIKGEQDYGSINKF